MCESIASYVPVVVNKRHVSVPFKGFCTYLAAVPMHLVFPCPTLCPAGGLVEPPVVPRFIEALQAAGATAVRVPAYLTTLGLPGPECCTAEAQLLQQGHVDAIAFSSTAEVGRECWWLAGGC